MPSTGNATTGFDAVLVVSFGGPEGPEDVIPFLENVLRGKNVPRERMLEVAEHYQHFGGVSPINEQNRSLVTALQRELDQHSIRLPVFWGNRNWHPLLPDTLKEMLGRGYRRILTVLTSAYSSYSGCRQYLEDLDRAKGQLVSAQIPGAGDLEFHKIRAFFNHPGFIKATAQQLSTALSKFEDATNVTVLYSAHSIPLAMAAGCDYEKQLTEVASLISDLLGLKHYEVVYQSRSGPPHQPWLEPDICDRIEELYQKNGTRQIVIAPIGFLSDHIEILFDLDTEAHEVCRRLGIQVVRAKTVSTHPGFVSMLRELIQEKLTGSHDRATVGNLPPAPDSCPHDCCPSGRPAAASTVNRGIASAARKPNDAGE